MNKHTTKLAGPLAAALLASSFLATAPLAQGPAQPPAHDHTQGVMPPGAPAGNSQAAMQGMQQMMSGMMGGMMADQGGMMMLHHTEGYLAFIRTELQIGESQNAAWTTFAEAVRNSARKARETMSEMGGPGMMHASWPDRLAASEKALTARLEAVKALRPAAVALYAVLTPDQKKKADELMVGAMGMR